MAKLCRGLPVGTYCNVACNSGIKICQIIGVLNLGGHKRRKLSATVGSLVVVTAKKAPKTLQKKIYKAVVIRQIKPIFRGHAHISFADNAVVILNEDLSLKGSRIKGIIAKQAEKKVPLLMGKSVMAY